MGGSKLLSFYFIFIASIEPLFPRQFSRMKPSRRLFRVLAAVLLSLSFNDGFSQLIITDNNSANALAQKLVGEGVIISNATVTVNSIATGFFKNIGGTNIGMDSGIVLTNGRAKSIFASNLIGLDGNGTFPAALRRADANLGLAGDPDLANEMGLPLNQLNDAIALEFDFIPLGDSIKFNYTVSSEEYTAGTVCVFYDGFAFFISGPGITGNKNIALVPGTSTPVTIRNVNNITSAGCVNNPQYYVDNTTNVNFTHEGHTTLFTAVSQVQPCQTYHMKLVVADKGDHAWDTGVFLEAGSLRSDPLKIESQNPLNNLNLPYLAEGCAAGGIHVFRGSKKPYPLTLNLTFAGSATNGVDVSTIPSTATILANDSVVVIPISTIADGIPEGIETLKIYIGNNCSGLYSDSIEIELRDIDLLPITPNDTIICRNGSVQLVAEPGYANYTWTNSSTLSNPNSNNPIATPTTATTHYIATASTGSCIAQDSVIVTWKTISLLNKTDVACKDGATGSFTVTGTGWQNPVSYAIDNNAYQPGNSFTGMRAGTYWVKIKDATTCVDSIQVSLVQSFPDITVNANPTAASCSITPDGKIEVLAGGGNGSYAFSSDGTSYQSNNILTVPQGTYTVYVKDGNGCISSLSPVVIDKVNTVTVDAGSDDFFCEGTTYLLNATSNATTVSWTPSATLTNANTLTPGAKPSSTTKYYITALTGTCTRTDSITLNVLPSPMPNAGPDVAICYGITAQLSGSGGTAFQWDPSSTFTSPTNISDPVVKPSVTTSYFLNVTDANGCTSLQADEVKVTVTPSVKIFAGNDTLVAINQPLQLHAIEKNNSGVTSWEWSSTASTAFLDNPFSDSPVAIFTAPVVTAPFEYVYTITGTTPAGCKGSDIINIKVYQGPEIYVPTAFTPNGDGKNDFLIPLPVGIKEMKYFRVFNRWGQVIFQSKETSRGWDGKISGSYQQSGVFVWMAEGLDYTGKLVTRRGMVTLVR
jgi:gliding motility-associated-like protein